MLRVVGVENIRRAQFFEVICGKREFMILSALALHLQVDQNCREHLTEIFEFFVADDVKSSNFVEMLLQPVPICNNRISFVIRTVLSTLAYSAK